MENPLFGWGGRVAALVFLMLGLLFPGAASARMFESFEGGTFPPPGWIKTNLQGGSGWYRLPVGVMPLPGWGNGTSSVPPTAGAGANNAYCSWTTGGSASEGYHNDQWLITPRLFGLSATSSLSFWLRFNFTNYPDIVYVRVSTNTAAPADFTMVIHTSVFARGSWPNQFPPWTNVVLNLGSLGLAAGTPLYVAFQEYEWDNTWNGAAVQLDVISSDLTPTPAASVSPTGLTFTAEWLQDPASPALYTVANIGSGGCLVSNVLVYAPNASGWLSQPAISSNLDVGGSLTVTARAYCASMAKGTYYATNWIYVPGATNSPLRQQIVLNVTKWAQSIGGFSIPSPQTYTSRVDLLNAATASSDLLVTYGVEYGPGKITNGIYLTFTNLGTVAIVAQQPGDGTWKPANAVTSVFTVIKAAPQFYFTNLTHTYDGLQKSVTVTTVPPGLAVALTYNGSTSAPVNAGSYPVKGTATSEFFAGTQTVTMTVNPAAQTVNFENPGTQYTTNTTALSATASSGLPVTFAVLSGNADLTDQTNLTYRSDGDVTITASQPGNGNWYAAATVTQQFAVEKSPASIGLTNLVQACDGTARTALVICVPSVPCDVTYDGATNVPVWVGSYTVTASVNDVMYYGAATGTLEVVKGTQTITFDAIENQHWTNTLALSASASSGLPVQFAVAGGPAVISGETNLAFTGIGEVRITASQTGSVNYLAASTVTNTFQALGPNFVLLGTNGIALESSNAVSALDGTDFGAARFAHDTPVRTFRLTNSGTAVLHLTGISTSGPGAACFTLHPSSVTLAPGAFTNLEVTFTPQAGTQTVAFTLLHDGTNSPFVLNNEGHGTGGHIQLATNALSYAATCQSNQPAAQTFVMTNRGSAAFTFTNTSSAAWLIPSPTGGEVLQGGSAVLTNTVNSTGLNAGIYTATNRLSAYDATNPPQEVLVTLTVDKASQSITFDNPGAQRTTNTTALSASASSGLPVTFTVLSGNADLTNQTNLTYRGAGEVVITASQAGNGNWYAAVTVTQQITVTKTPQPALIFSPASPQRYGTTNTLSVTGGQGTGAVSFAVTTGGGRLEGGTNLAATAGTGSITVVAAKAADAMYEGTAATAIVEAVKGDQTLLFPPISAQDTTNVTVLSATASSGLPVTYTVVSGNADLTGQTNLTYRSEGEVTIAASQAGSDLWNAAASVTNTFMVNKSTQRPLVFAPPATQVYLTTNRLTASGGSGTGAVSFAVLSGPGTIIGADSLAVNASSGTVTVTASKAADSLFAAQTVTAAVLCTRSGQTIDFPTIGRQHLTNSVPLAATASSGLPVTFTVLSGPGVLANGTNLTFTERGRVWIAAVQDGNEHWEPAAVTQSVDAVACGAALDFDGDGLADVAVYWPAQGMWYILQSSNGLPLVQAWGWAAAEPVPDDYDGDGLMDVAVYAATNGTWHIFLSGTQTNESTSWGWSDAEPVPADYDGDGLCDIAVYAPENGTWHIWQSGSLTPRVQVWGWTQAQAVPGDYDGDGCADVAVYSAANGTWYIWQSATQTGRIQPWGWNEAEPIPGDYDGDGLADVAVYHALSGLWYAWLSASQTGMTTHWGWSEAFPVPADYDGDGIFDRTVYAPKYGMWYLWQSALQTGRTQPWGFGEAEPVR